MTLPQLASTDDLIPPLEPGAVVLERFAIRELLQQTPERNVYRVGIPRVCANCGVENDGSAIACGFCQTELAPGPALLLSEQRALTDAAAFPPGSFLFGGQLYAITRALDDAPSAALAPPLVGIYSDVGLVRGMMGQVNQDGAFAQWSTLHTAEGPYTLGLFAVADGVGGAQAGEVASRMALCALGELAGAQWFCQPAQLSERTMDTWRGELRDMLYAVNDRLLEYAAGEGLQCGTTLAAALVMGNQLVLGNVGDSRIYLWRAGALERMTRDHSYVAQLVAGGALAPDAVYTHPQRNVILKSLGDASGYEADLFPEAGGGLTLRAGDQLVLCTDGLWEMVHDDELARILAKAPDPRTACARLVAQANAAGGPDNSTAIVVKF